MCSPAYPRFDVINYRLIFNRAKEQGQAAQQENKGNENH